MRISDWSSDVCSSDLSSQAKLGRELAELFDLDNPPRRIEIYDNSHIQGTNALGAMVVAGPEGWIKGAYRKFNIKRPETQPGDRSEERRVGQECARYGRYRWSPYH